MSENEKILLCLGMALAVALVTALIIGPERKMMWFRKRKKEGFFTKRGPLGEVIRFGVPVTVEGYAVTAIMVGIIGIGSYFIWQL